MPPSFFQELYCYLILIKWQFFRILWESQFQIMVNHDKTEHQSEHFYQASLTIPRRHHQLGNRKAHVQFTIPSPELQCCQLAEFSFPKCSLWTSQESRRRLPLCDKSDFKESVFESPSKWWTMGELRPLCTNRLINVLSAAIDRDLSMGWMLGKVEFDRLAFRFNALWIVDVKSLLSCKEEC